MRYSACLRDETAPLSHWPIVGGPASAQRERLDDHRRRWPLQSALPLRRAATGGRPAPRAGDCAMARPRLERARRRSRPLIVEEGDKIDETARLYAMRNNDA
jgi:hypothetical protein